jgi:peroxiredoxin
MRTTRFICLPIAMIAIVLSARLAAAQNIDMWDVGLKVGAEAPAAMVQRLDGTTANLSDFYGKHPVVLEFWATWCPLCRQLEPSLQAAREKFAGKATFIGVGVSANQTLEKQRRYVEDRKLSGTWVFDANGAAMKAYAVPHTSYIVIVGTDRRVRYAGVGAEQDIEAALLKAGVR